MKHDAGTGVPYSARNVTSIKTDPKSGAVTTASWATIKGVSHQVTETRNPSGRIHTYVTSYKSSGAVTSHTVYTPARVINGKSHPAESSTKVL